MIVQLRNEKVSNHGSIPITIDCNVVAFIVFEEGFHQPIKRTKQSVFLDVTVFRHTVGSLFVDVAIQPEVCFLAKQNSLMKIGNNGNLVLGPFDESKSVVQADCFCIKSSNSRIYVTVWCQKWGFMRITREMDEQLKALLEGINALKSDQEDMQKSQEEAKERMMENMQRSQE
ncbi:hypothetical protein TNCV_4340541 [Trichonephila clavipes]|nr:hypothetical protein TNCV_4340541 [Trichonephila clavipes]